MKHISNKLIITYLKTYKQKYNKTSKKGGRPQNIISVFHSANVGTTILKLLIDLYHGPV